MLCTIYRGRRLLEAYLESCGLPLATKALGVGSAAWLVVVSYWVMEGDFLAVFLTQPGAGEDGMLRVFMWDCVARFRTLNSNIPSL